MSQRPLLLAVSPVAPWPTTDGISLRVHHLLRELARSWEIVLVAPAVHETHRPTMPSLPLARYVEVPRRDGGWLHADSRDIAAAATEAARSLRPACALAWSGAEHAWLDDGTLSPLVADRVDSGALTVWRDLWMQRTLRARLGMARLLVEMTLYERRVARRAVACTAVGERDVSTIRRVGGRDSVFLVPNGVVLPDVASLPKRSAVPSAIFSGVLGYGPNIDAAVFAAREIWPRVVARCPEARLIIAGRGPVPEVLALAGEPGVELRIDVPDMRHELASAWIALAPMRTGTGIKNKVLEAWACATPAVMTRLATNGLEMPPESEWLVADGADAIAERIVRLMSDAGWRARAGADARALTERSFTWSGVADRLSRILTQSIA